ncbi:serine hydrolase domain-containing protein [Ningiella sp. W23]|uniref:serine hydrolase domain-containing protein n=1 Tax=Ningiella sp. W23 TaxID=3023715 RepID=UPI003756C55F
MKKWIAGILLTLLVVAAVAWFSLDKSVRFLLLNPPANENVLFWSTAQRDAGFRSIEKINILPLRTVLKGEAPSTDSVFALNKGDPLSIDDDYLQNYMRENRAAALIVMHKGKVVLEKYGLDFNADEKWTSFSVAKSFTSTLVGAAIKDGFITSLDDKVSDYIHDMRGSVYDDVSIEQLLTMTSGVKWNEDYSDPNSDVSKFNFEQADDGVDATASYMRSLSRAAPAGSQWLYSTGETNLIGLLIVEATGKTLSEYLSEKVWSKIGAEQDATWILGATGNEIGGCCIQATTRDYLRFGQYVLSQIKASESAASTESIVPDGWWEKAVTTQADIGSSTGGYGFQWWTSNDGSFEGKGIFGQGLFIDPQLDLVIALNSNWENASGGREIAARQAMYQRIQQAVLAAR